MLLLLPIAPLSAVEKGRIEWWKEARFGLFIHWGLYAIPGGVWQEQVSKHPYLGTEWIMAYRQIPVAEYGELAKRFNPIHFDAESWVLAAKNAGMRYIVFTAKHHDGFALFDSQASDFNVVRATPFGRDVVAELAAACQKHGIQLGLYYSQAQDWTHTGGAVSSFMKRWDSSHAGSMEKYIEGIAVPQVKEILTKYGQIAVIWWDTPEGMTPEFAAKLEETLSLQPGIIQNSRLAPRKNGDYRVVEGQVPWGDVPGTPWEVCRMMNESWGFSKLHQHWVSVTRLIQDLIQTTSLGGNFLLNVGPDAEGRFEPQAMERLAGIGDWMRKNGEAIYGASGFPMKKMWQQGRITRKPGKLYACVFLWPPSGTLTIPVQAKVKSVALLTNPEHPLPFTMDVEGVKIDVRNLQPDEHATVFLLEIDGSAKEAEVSQPLDADSSGVFDLLAPFSIPTAPEGTKPSVRIGKREGTTPPLTQDPAESLKLFHFLSPKEKAVWRIRVPNPGRYTVIAYAGLAKKMPSDCEALVQTGSQVARTNLNITGENQTFVPFELGDLQFETAGEHEISATLDLKNGDPKGGELWRIQLIPKK